MSNFWILAAIVAIPLLWSAYSKRKPNKASREDKNKMDEAKIDWALKTAKGPKLGIEIAKAAGLPVHSTIDILESMESKGTVRVTREMVTRSGLEVHRITYELA